MKTRMKNRQADRHHIFRPIKRKILTGAIKKMVAADGKPIIIKNEIVAADGRRMLVGKEMTMTYNILGRKVLRKNPELFKIFRELRDLPVEELVSKAKQGINLGYAKITHFAERWAGYPEASHVLRITLANGREFAFKISSKNDNDFRQDLPASYKAMQLGTKSIKCYVQFQFPKSGRYFVLMELSSLPTVKEYIEAQAKIRDRSKGILYAEVQERIRKALAAQVRLEYKLAGTGVLDVLPHNMFVRETPQGKIELVLFDLGLLKEHSPKPKHYIE